MYVLRFNPRVAGKVFQALLEQDEDEKYIKNLLETMGANCPNMAELVEAFETKDQLKLMREFLEARINEGNTLAELHNAIGKLYIDISKNPENFLKTNKY